MKKINILAIAPYEGLKELIINTANERPDISVSVFTGNLEDGIKFAENSYTKEFDIIISRGGTAEMLKKVSTIPVINIEISVYDMLRAIKLAQYHTGKFAIVGFPSITNTSRLICDILKYAIDIFEINSAAEAEECLINLKKNGYNLIIGDVVTVNVATHIGLNEILITSGKESIAKAFADAVHLHQNILLTQKDALLYKDVVDSSETLTLLFDKKKKLIYTNISDENSELFKISDVITEYLDKLSEESQLRLLKKYNDLLLKITAKTLNKSNDNYYVFYVDYSVNPVVTLNSCITIKNYTDYNKQINFLHVSSEYMRPIIEKVNKLSSSMMPVFICGELGTGKDSIAQYIHLSSPHKRSPLIIIDCEPLTEKKWQSMVDCTGSPLNDTKYTIYFKNIHMLSAAMQKMLDAYMEETSLLKRHHIISSSVYDLHDLVAEADFLRSLYLKLYCLTIYMPSLKERTDDIPALASLCISQYNMEHAKHVIGFDDESLELLKNYQWELNLDQLQRVIKQLVLLTDSSYISAKDVKSVLPPTKTSPAVSTAIDLTKPLDDIVRDVINSILIDENMNQSKAAKRLGISRSTMWRKLKT